MNSVIELEGCVITKMVSGGQTGADRAALDVAIRHGLPHGGWCPKGRRAEDGPIGGQYFLQETPSANDLQRTEWNVRDSDGTVVFTLAPEPLGGSLKSLRFAEKHCKPCIHLAPDHLSDAALFLQQFATEHQIATLNVAGPRESEEPGLYAWVCRSIEDAFFWSDNNPYKLGGPGEG